MCTAQAGAAQIAQQARSDMATSVASAFQTGAGIIGATNQYAAGRAEQAYYKAKAYGTEQNAYLTEESAKRQVKYDVQAAAEQVKQLRRAGRKTAGAQINEAAAGGMDLSSVSLQDVMLDSLRAEQEDIELIKRQSSARAYETLLQAELNTINAKSQAAQERLAGKNARRAGRLNAFGTLLSTAGTVASMWGK